MNQLSSVVVLNWNGLRFIEKCLSALKDQSYKNLEIILVDNGSTDGSLERVVDNFNSIKIVKNNKNYGFARGMNIGITAATGKYVMALNMDVCLDHFCIEKMVSCLEQNNTCGAIMGKEYTWDDNGFFDIPTRSSGPGYLKKRGQGARDKTKINDRTMSFGAMGSFPMFRSSCLKELKNNVGYYFDEKYVTGWEDKDIFFRLHHIGFSFVYEPSAIGYHYGSGSVGEKTLIRKDYAYQVRIFRNRYYFIFKNYPRWLLHRHSLYLFFTEIVMWPYFFIKNPKCLQALLVGQLEFLRNFRSIKNDRELIQGSSKLTKDKTLDFFKGF